MIWKLIHQSNSFHLVYLFGISLIVLLLLIYCFRFGFLYSRSFGPRVEFVNGKIVIKEQNSDQNNENDLDVDAENNDVDVEESNDICTTTYSSFSKRRRTAAWGIQETSNFYNVRIER